MNFSTNAEVGTLVAGFEGVPYLMMPWTPPYYTRLLEAAGYGKAKDLFAYLISWHGATPDFIARIAGRARRSARIAVRKLEMRRFREELELVKKKIAALMDQQRDGRDATATRQAVLDVALAHHLVSKYTSLVAVDVTPARPANKALQSHAMKTNLPDGQDYEAIFGLPQTATSGQLQILLGLAALLAAWLLWSLRDRVA